MSNEREKYLKSIDKSLKGIDKSLNRIANAVDDPEDKPSPGSSGLSAQDIMNHIDNEDQEPGFAAAAELNEDDRNYRRG